MNGVAKINNRTAIVVASLGGGLGLSLLHPTSEAKGQACAENRTGPHLEGSSMSCSVVESVVVTLGRRNQVSIVEEGVDLLRELRLIKKEG